MFEPTDTVGFEGRRKISSAEQIYHLYKMEQEKKMEEHRAKRKKNMLLTAAVAIGYAMIYLAGRIFGTTGEQASVMEWLFGNNPRQLSYLYGWLIWGCIFVFSIIMGMILERLSKNKLGWKSPKLWIWLAISAAGIFAIVLLVRMSMPTSFS